MTRPPHFALRRLYGRAAAAARAIQQMRCHKAGLAALTAGVEGLEILSEKRIGRLVEGCRLRDWRDPSVEVFLEPLAQFGRLPGAPQGSQAERSLTSE